MTYALVDDSLCAHPKVMALGEDRLAALGLWLVARGYVGRYLTDGYFPRSVIAGESDADRLANRLVEVGLWERTPDGGFVLHDYLDWNRSKAEVLEARAVARERATKAARARWNASSTARRNAHVDARRMPTDIDTDTDTDTDTDMTFSDRDGRGGSPEGLDRIASAYRALYHREPTDGASAYLAALSDGYGEERVLNALAGEFERDSNPKTIIGRMHRGLKTGDAIRQAVATTDDVPDERS